MNSSAAHIGHQEASADVLPIIWITAAAVDNPKIAIAVMSAETS